MSGRRIAPGLRPLVRSDPEGVGLTGDERQAVRVRLRALRTGRCGWCRARAEAPNATDGYAPVVIAHAADCPATSPAALSGMDRLGLSPLPTAREGVAS